MDKQRGAHSGGETQRIDRALGTLCLALNGTFFDQVVRGDKTEEFRLCTPFWTRRLEGRNYASLVLTRGYPPKGDDSKRLTLPWRGVTRRVMQLDFFGPRPVEVFAIRLAEPDAPHHNREHEDAI